MYFICSKYPLHIFCCSLYINIVVKRKTQYVVRSIHKTTNGMVLFVRWNIIASALFVSLSSGQKSSHIRFRNTRTHSPKCTQRNLTDCCVPDICRTGVQIGLSGTSIIRQPCNNVCHRQTGCQQHCNEIIIALCALSV